MLNIIPLFFVNALYVPKGVHNPSLIKARELVVGGRFVIYTSSPTLALTAH